MNKNLPFFLTTFLTIFITTTSLNIPLNSSLTTLNPTQTWSSPNNTFTLHFIPLNSTSYTLSITYGTTSIWSPTSTAVSAGSTFRLDSSGDLQLVSADNKIAWHSNTSNLGITHATLDDTGNLMLMNSSNNVLWSTFDNPTDTLVTLQNFTVGMKLSSGLYSFFLNSTGNMTLQWNDNIEYFSLGLNSSVSTKLSRGDPKLMLQGGILSIYDSNMNLLQKTVYGSDYDGSDTGNSNTGNNLRFIRLDSDGNLRMYTVDSGSSSSDTVTWTAVSDQCLVFGYCGNMGICSYNETSPVCGCPSENFDAVDEEDSRKGCKLKEEIKDCPNSVGLLEMDNTRFLNYPPETNDAYYENSVACRANCLSGASCVVSTSVEDGSGQCYIKSSSFVSGYQSGTVPSTSYVKVCGPVVPNPPPSEDTQENKKLKGWVIGVVILVTVVVLLLLQGSVWWWCCRKNPKFASLSAQYALLEYASGAPVQFSYRELQQATTGFKEKLGEGGFGTVYKAVLANRTLAAVKQLEGIEQGEKQFRMEVATISSTHHLNLVRLIGFCSEGRHRLLVYEFMKNGSLDSFLFGTGRSREKSLTWENRFSIAVGTAKGITYLHEECRDCIVHCDIKPENILLDDNYNAKVSDFGLAKLVSPQDHRYRTLTSVRGTRGYLPPEWIANLPITSKSDVYSFGMVLLEIVSGRRNFEVSEDTNRKKFSIWAYEEFDRGNINSIVDRRFGSGEVDMVQVTRAIQVSFWCIQEQPSQRPMMGKVVQMLEGIMEIPRPPIPKAAIDGSSSGASFNMSGISTRSTLAASGPDPSLSSSSRTQQPPSSLSGVNPERPNSSLA
ncbi:G-type lectin S-receptor-like serine/threonine-protein kinase At1g34300 [Silene latifolia]|uniref:G-type lectin S-receptor-like serine/threonine-protein kinase At1g34300 n=1 Tax=Silene latifolia TaxID=37657 RepID=UPI003D779E33